MGIDISDGIRYVTCDGCHMEVRGTFMTTKDGRAFHEGHQPGSAFYEANN